MIETGRTIQGDKKGDQNNTTQVAAIPPKVSCPSAPIFQNFRRKAIKTPKPVSIKGIALTRVSVKFGQVPKAPLNMAAYVTKGLVLNIVSKIAVNKSEIKKEARGTSKMALRDSVFLFSKTMRISYL